MNYREVLPPAHLKKYIRYCWILESAYSQDSSIPFRTMADGCPGLIYQSKEKGVLEQGNKKLSELFLFGQSTRYTELQLKGNFQAAGIHFYPDTLNVLFRFPAQELTDSCIDLNELSKKHSPPLSEQLSSSIFPEQQLNILFSYLTEKIQVNSGLTDASMKYALTKITASKGLISLKELQEDLRLSERSMERKFKAYTGISPKLFSRICRFQAALGQIRNNQYEKFSDIAYEQNYADQSHFIRSFKEFSGLSPFQYQKNAFEIVENLSQLAKP